jgi:hypothetical protein
MACSVSTPSLPSSASTLSALLQPFVQLNEESISQHLNEKTLAIQAGKKGKRLVSASHVRSIFWEEKTTTAGENSVILSVLYVGSLVESEYINTLHVYFTYCLLSKNSIILSKCCCVAENRKDGACKHRAALLYALSIIQTRQFHDAPKQFRPSIRTLLNLKGESDEKLEKFRIWPWTKTVSLMFESWPSSMKKKYVLHPLPAPSKGRKKDESQRPHFYPDISCLPQISHDVLSALLPQSSSLPQIVSQHGNAVIAPANELTMSTAVPQQSPPISTSPEFTSSPIEPIEPPAQALPSVPQKRKFRGPLRNSDSAYHVSKHGRLCFAKYQE